MSLLRPTFGWTGQEVSRAREEKTWRIDGGILCARREEQLSYPRQNSHNTKPWFESAAAG